MVYSVTVGKQ